MILRSAIFQIALCALCSGLYGQVVINEFMASNQGVFRDSLGQSSDWLELYNAGPATVNLGGWMLSDDAANPGKWTFPNASISAGGFLLVWASDEDLFDGYNHHTNFRLNASGEDIVLSNASGVVQDQLTYSQQFSNTSRGRLADGGNVWVFFDPGTPGASNALGDTVEPISTDVYFSSGPGFYEEPLELAMTTLNESYDIYYTVNGDRPSVQAIKYTAPITLTEDNMPEVFLSHIPTSISWRQPVGEVQRCHVIRAQAFLDGQPIGRERKGSFFIDDKGDDLYEHAIVSIITPSRNLFDPDTGIYFYGLHENYMKDGDEWERQAHIEFFDDGDLVLFQDVGIRLTGGLSRIRPQKSIKLYARDEYGDNDLDYPFFGEDYIDDFKRLTLRALNNNWTPTAISDDVAHEISHRQDLNYAYQRRRFAVVFINGEYWGVHSLREATDEFFLAERYGLDRDDIIIGGSGKDSDEYDAFKAFVEENDMADPEKYAEALSQMDVDNLLDYYVSELFFANHDWPHNNNRAWKETSENGIWRWIFYDLDGGLQQYKHGYFRMFFEPEELHVRGERYDGFRFLISLLDNETFRSMFRAKLIYHLNNTFSPSITVPILRELEEEIDPEISEHQRRWNYPNGIRRWRESIDNTNNFLVLRADILLTEVFEKMGIPLDIFPNPVVDKVYGEIDLGTDQTVNFYLTSMDGKFIYLGNKGMQAGKNSFEFDLSPMNGGTYVLSAITDFQIYSKRIVLAPR